jgi:flagellar hook-length control protein FliK
LRFQPFTREQGPLETVVSDDAAAAVSLPAWQQVIPELSVRAAPAINTGVVSERASADNKASVVLTASVASTVENEKAILSNRNAVLPAQAATPLAAPAAAPLHPLESSLAPAAGLVFATNDTPDLLPVTAQSWLGKTPRTDAAAAVNANVPTADMRAQDALRLTLAMPAPELTKRLAQMSGTGKESTWAALLASGPLAKESAVPTADTLHLEVPPDYDLTLDIASPTDTLAKNSDLAAQSGTAAPQLVAQTTMGGNADSNANSAQAQADHRAQQFQQMADQMGQAAAQRLIAQIERGQWKLQMQMQPAALGTVKVELDMHAGGLDASFSADNAITRELMVQGSNRLKETLADAGMTVASVIVNRDQSRQSGGNSTPGKGRSPSTSVGAGGRTSAAKVLAPSVADTPPKDGLNVLA